MLVFGHRGAAGLAPENTLQSFQKALELNVDGIEFDVRLCDGKLVIFHDKQLTRRTNGKGLLSNISFSDLRDLDAGNRQQVPTLQEACQLISNQAIINIELKGKGTAKAVITYLLSSDNKIPLENFIISSFRHKELRVIREMNQVVKLGVLAKRHYNKALIFAMSVNAYSFHPCLQSVTKKHINKMIDRNLQVYVFTVNKASDYEKLEKWSVNGIFTDFPDRINGETYF